MDIEPTASYPIVYRITFKGRFQQSWASMFGNLTVIDSGEDSPGSVTTVLAYLPDEAALMGLLMHFYDLGIWLVSVICLSNQPAEIV